MRAAKADLLAYVKPTNRCNVGCSHCYLSEEVRATKDKMSSDTLANVGHFLSDMASRENKGRVHVLWHGGEPMNLNPDWYREAGSVLDHTLGAHVESMQTSLIPFNSDWIDLVHERFDGHLGSSVDFSGLRTIKGSGERYMSFWLKKADEARTAGIQITPGMVPTRNDLGRVFEILDWMEAHDFPAFNIDRYNQFGEKQADCPSNVEHASFLTELFDMVMARVGGHAPQINVIEAALGGVLNGEPGDRWGGHCQSNFVVIEPDGSLNTCPDRSAWEGSFGQVQAGHQAFSGSSMRRKWIRLQESGHRNNHCASCEYASWCRSGCPITHNDPDGEGDCSGYKSFLNHVKGYVSTQDGMATAIRYMGWSRA
ncbi:radical SAM protein [Thiobacillus denitrificans]|uniref:radical SAM protein n=1 Tax=Thiobacillus denitrificans TaxID=36861 RepID=UPI00036FE8B4|nr:SPASM domain-containing protein [Thiobacillus denitrificans]